MNKPSFYPTKQTWDVLYTTENGLANMSGTDACCRHSDDKCLKCPPDATDVMRESILVRASTFAPLVCELTANHDQRPWLSICGQVNEQGHAKFTVIRSP